MEEPDLTKWGPVATPLMFDVATLTEAIYAEKNSNF